MLFEPRTILESDRIQLHKPQATFETANALYQLVDKNRKHLLPWVDMADKVITGSPEDAFVHLTNMVEKWKSQYAFEYLIYETRSSKLIGVIGVYQPYPEHKSVEVGFWIAKDYSRRGFMREALRLIEKEFFFLEFERIVIRSDIENYGARNLAIKSGYRLEGTLRHSCWSNQFHMYRDLNVFAKIKNEN